MNVSCLRNVVSMFHVIEQEIQWRKDSGLAEGFEQLKGSRPIVAIGADGPLGDQRRMADYFRMNWCKLRYVLLIKGHRRD